MNKHISNSKQGLLVILYLIILVYPGIIGEFKATGSGHDGTVMMEPYMQLMRNHSAYWPPVARSLEHGVAYYRESRFSSFYPFMTYDFGFSAGKNPWEVAEYGVNILVYHLIFGIIGFGVLSRVLGYKFYTGVLSGIIFLLSFHVKFWSSWIWNPVSYSWFGWLAAGAILIIKPKRHLLGVCITALAAIAIFNLTPPGVAYAGLFVLCLLIGYVWENNCFRTNFLSDSRYRQFVVRGYIAAVFFVIVGSINHYYYLIPELKEFIRWTSVGPIIGSMQPPYEATLDNSLPFSWFLEVLIPGPNRLGVAFVGMYTAFVALYGTIFCEKKRLVIPILFVGTLLALDGMGDKTPIHRLLYNMPVIGAIRYPSAKLILLVVSMSIAFMVGSNELLKRPLAYNSKKFWCLFSALLFLLILGVSLNITPDKYLNLKFLALVIGLPVIAVLLLPVLGGIKSENYRAFVFILISFLGLSHHQISTGPSKLVPQNGMSSLDCELVSYTWDKVSKIDSNNTPLRLVPDTFNFSDSKSPACKKISSSGDLLNIIALSGSGVPSFSVSPRNHNEFKYWYPKTPNVSQNYLNRVGAQKLSVATSETALEKMIVASEKTCNAKLTNMSFSRPDKLSLTLQVDGREGCNVSIAIPDDGYLNVTGARHILHEKRDHPLGLYVTHGENVITVEHRLPLFYTFSIMTICSVLILIALGAYSFISYLSKNEVDNT